MPNTSGGGGAGGVCPFLSPRRDGAAPRVSGERPSKRPYGHPSSDLWNLPVLSSIVHVFCPFRVRQKLLKAGRNASNRLRPLLHPLAREGFPLCGFFHRPWSPQVEGSRPQDSAKAKAPVGRRAFSSGSVMSTTATARERGGEREGGQTGRGQLSASSFPAHGHGNLRSESSRPVSKGPCVPGEALPVAQYPGREGGSRKPILLARCVSKRR